MLNTPCRPVTTFFCIASSFHDFRGGKDMIFWLLHSHQNHPLFFLETESFIKSGQGTLAGGNQMETYNALPLEVSEALLQQSAGDASSLVLGCNGEVVDLEGAAIVEQHGNKLDI